MSRFSVVLIFVLCISEYARAKTVTEILANLEELKSEVKTTQKELQGYTESRLNKLSNIQEKVQQDFKTELKSEVTAALDSLQKISTENSLKLNECVKQAKADLNRLEVQAPEFLQDCVDWKESHSLNKFFSTLLDYDSTVPIIIEAIENLEVDAKAVNGETNSTAAIEERLANIKTAVHLWKKQIHVMMGEGDSVIEKAKRQSNECSRRELTKVHSIAVKIVNSCN